jgi:hypothetical protein
LIHHLSIAVRDPRHVAEVLAELMAGRAYPFPGPLPGAFMAVGGDCHGTMVEVYPEKVVLEPGSGDEPVRFSEGAATGAGSVHFLLSVPRDLAAIERIGAREGWRTRLFGRGAPGQPPLFHVVEFWIENRLLVELAPQSMIGAYLDIYQFEILDRHFSNRAAA